MNLPGEWLLQGDGWIEYRTRVDLLGEAEEAPQVQAARRVMLADPRLGALLKELGGWPGTVISSHKSSGQPFHKLMFLTDLGVRVGDPGVEAITAAILRHQSPEGPFTLPVNVPVHYGGSGEDTWGWALCDAPLVTCAMVRLGLGSDPAVKQAAANLAGRARDNGWPCVVSKELGNFRGPGRKSDPCPFATLAMLKLLAELEDWRDSPAVRSGADALLGLWEDRAVQHPYQFYMGTDFCKLKLPFVWYDLLHVLDTLSRFPWLRSDARLLNMLALLLEKADAQGRFTPESVWTAWGNWEFGQKKAPSRGLTMAAWRIIRRIQPD